MHIEQNSPKTKIPVLILYRRKKCKTCPNTARYSDQNFTKKPILGGGCRSNLDSTLRYLPVYWCITKISTYAHNMEI